MKYWKYVLFFVIAIMPIIIFGQDVQVPSVVTDTINDALTNFGPKTFALSSAMVAIVQTIKVALAKFQIDISGIKSKILAITVAVIYVLINLNVWADGSISQADIVLIIQSVISAVSGIYGYKLLWRKTEVCEEQIQEQKAEEVKQDEVK